MPFFSSKSKKKQKEKQGKDAEESELAPSILADEVATSMAEEQAAAAFDAALDEDPENESNPDSPVSREYNSGSMSSMNYGSGSIATENGERALVVHPAFAATKGERSVVKRAAQDVAVAAVSAGLIGVGVSTVVAPVLAVVIVVGHVVVRGMTRLVERKVAVSSVDQQAHLEQLQLTKAQPADHLTLVINGVLGDDGESQCFNAFLSPYNDPSYAQVNAGHLTGISKLIGSNMKCTVRDMGGFTEQAQTPFSVRLSMLDVLALIRQSWVYERFAETKCGTMTVVVIKSQRGSTKLRLAWSNHGDLNATQATVYTEREWKKTSYAGKTRNLPDGFADVDMPLDRNLVFVS